MGLFFDKRDAIDRARRLPATGLPTGFGERFASARRGFLDEAASNSEFMAIRRGYEDYVGRVRELTGDELQNPLDATAGVSMFGTESVFADVRARAKAADALENRIHEIVAERPELRDELLPIPTPGSIIESFAGEAAARRARQAEAAGRSTLGGQIGAVLGTFAGAVQDPLILLSLPFGAAAGTTILRAALIEAAIGTGIEAAIQPQVFRFKRMIGSPYSADEAALNVLLGGIGAGVGAAGLRATGRVLAKTPRTARGLLERFRETYRTEAPPRATTAAEDAAEAVVERAVEIEEATPYPRTPPGDAAHQGNLRRAGEAVAEGRTVPEADIVRPAEGTAEPPLGRFVDDQGREFTVEFEDDNHRALYDYATSAQRDPAQREDLFRRFEGFVEDVEKPEDIDALADDVLEEVADAATTSQARKTGRFRYGSVIDSEEKAEYLQQFGRAARGIAQARNFQPSGLARLEPDEIEVDPDRFQFKTTDDPEGLTGALAGVETFDERLAGTILVYEDAGGRRFVADGHQRVNLAKRAKAAGQRDVALNAFLLREIDGFMPSEARAIAAFKNISEGTGTAVDAAKVIREAGERGLPPLPPRSALVRDARGLARLGDEAFGITINEVVPANYAAIVGRLVDDPSLQVAIMRVLAKVEPQNVRQAEAVVRQAREAGASVERQKTLFGDEFVTSSLFAERAKVLDTALRKVRQDRRTFRTLVERRRKIEEAGNRLDTGTNLRRANRDEQIQQLLATLATRKGPISDALTDAARALKEGRRRTAGAADDFLRVVRRAAEDGLLDGPDAGGSGRAHEVGFGADEADLEAQGAAATERAEAVERAYSDDAEAPIDAAMDAEVGRLFEGQSSGTPSRASRSGSAGGAFDTSARSAPPGPQAPSRQVSTLREPSGISTRRAMIPPRETGEPTVFDEFLLGATDQASGRTILQGTDDFKSLRSEAARVEPLLRAELEGVARDLDGVTLFGTRAKGLAGIEAQIATGRPPRTISDYLGGRLWARDQAALNDVLDELRRRFRLVQEDHFLEAPRFGYRAVHLQADIGGGMTVEIQVVPEAIGRVQEEAQAIYDKWKRKVEIGPEDAAAYKADRAEAERMFDEAWAEFQAATEARAEAARAAAVPVGERVDPETGDVVPETAPAQDVLREAEGLRAVADEFKGCLE